MVYFPSQKLHRIGFHACFHCAFHCAIYKACAREHPFIRIIEIARVPIDGKTPVIHFTVPREAANFGWTTAIYSIKIKELTFKSCRKAAFGLAEQGFSK